MWSLYLWHETAQSLNGRADKVAGSGYRILMSFFERTMAIACCLALSPCTPSHLL